MSIKPLYEPGTLVTFHFSWYGRTNPHDGHRCRVVESRIERTHGRNYFRYLLEDLELPAGSRAKAVFKMTDSRANETVLVPV